MKILAFALTILPLVALADSGLPNQPYIYSEGTAEIQKPADIVTLHFNLVARAPEQSKANDDVQAKSVKIFSLLNGKKVAENDVIAENLQSEPEFEQSEGYSRNRGKLTGYVVTRAFTIKIRDVPSFPKLIDELIAVGNVEFSSVEGGLANEKEMKDQIRDKALVDARARADKILKTMDMKVDSVFAVSTVPFLEIGNQLFPSETTRLGVRSAQIEAAPNEAAREYRLAPITVNQSVHVIYLISPAK